MAKRIPLVVTYDTDSKKFTVDTDTTALLFPDGVYFDDDTEYWSDQPLVIEDVIDRLAMQLSSPTVTNALGAEDPVPTSTKFVELALNILDPDFNWGLEETLAASDAAGRFLTEYPITEWEIEGAFGLVVQFVHDWATGEYHDSVSTSGPASVFNPISDHDLDVLDMGVDMGPTFE